MSCSCHKAGVCSCNKWTFHTPKLYSSSFNPIFNSLNNKYLSLPGFLSKSTAQINILKNNNSNNPLNPTELILDTGFGAVIRENKTSLVKVIKPKATKPVKVEHNSQVVSAPALLRQYKPQHTPIRGDGKGSGINNSNITVVTVPHTAKSKSNSVALTLPSNYTSYVAFSHLTDNKKFLFLYFIVPIFFATLKNSTSSSSLAQGRVQNLNNQIKQLRSLIKLMLDSGSSLRSQWVQNRRDKLNNFTLLPLTANLKSAQFTLAEDINYLMESLRHSTNIFKTKKVEGG